MSEPVLEMRGIALGYGGRTVVSIDTLVVRRGQWLALVGPNASGKTTLLRCAAGRLSPTRGEVLFAGLPLHPHARESPALAVGPEELPAFLSVRQALEIQAAARGMHDIPGASLALCDELGVQPHLRSLVGELSLGTRQKVAVVLALLGDPALLLLDEVFNGLDVRSSVALKRHLRSRVASGLSIVLATHALDVVRDCCDGLVLIDAGRPACSWDRQRLQSFADTAAMEQALVEALPPAG